jgi:hypothetical protein
MSNTTPDRNNNINSFYSDEFGRSILKGFSIAEITFYGVLAGLVFPVIAWSYDSFSMEYLFQVYGKCIWTTRFILL